MTWDMSRISETKKIILTFNDLFNKHFLNTKHVKNICDLFSANAWQTQIKPISSNFKNLLSIPTTLFPIFTLELSDDVQLVVQALYLNTFNHENAKKYIEMTKQNQGYIFYDSKTHSYFWINATNFLLMKKDAIIDYCLKFKQVYAFMQPLSDWELNNSLLIIQRSWKKDIVTLFNNAEIIKADTPLYLDTKTKVLQLTQQFLWGFKTLTKNNELQDLKDFFEQTSAFELSELVVYLFDLNVNDLHPSCLWHWLDLLYWNDIEQNNSHDDALNLEIKSLIQQKCYLKPLHISEYEYEQLDNKYLTSPFYSDLLYLKEYLDAQNVNIFGKIIPRRVTGNDTNPNGGRKNRFKLKQEPRQVTLKLRR